MKTMNERIKNLCNTINELSKVVAYYQSQNDNYKAAIDEFTIHCDDMMRRYLFTCLEKHGAKYDTI